MINTKLTIDDRSYKIGINEVGGLKGAMLEAMKPVREYLRDKAYWDSSLEMTDAEYKSRDGFIAYSTNCGGIQLSLHIPECQQYEFSFVEFGEHDDTCCNDQGCDYQDGELDAFVRIWLKFEGIDNDGLMSFYLVMSGGNEDAPYFRESKMPALFETEFTAKSLDGFTRQANAAVKKLIKHMDGAK